MLKELEKLGPKKGVISQSVKDVIQSLVDDDLVLKDRKFCEYIFTFGSLPSCAGNQLRNVSNKLGSNLKSSKKRLAELIEQRDGLKKGREDSDEREEALAELKTVETKYNELKSEMGQYADNDPATLEAMTVGILTPSYISILAENAIEVSHAAANHYTIFGWMQQSWCSNNFPQAKEQLEHLYTEVIISTTTYRYNRDYLELVNPVIAQI
ncbi:hypothetical protein MKW94_024849 [Papaver nudicaule]|uniref:Mnd1 HTH domain-containing protein n=1 Tax=Papaver nudicaule TaxID=74823 RepID=A0AA42B1C0_PAPNU|nr:hypothetical protein [Papaver nudicaule]